MPSHGRRISLSLVVAFSAIAAASATWAGSNGLKSDGVYEIPVAGVAGVPLDVSAVALQVTVADATEAGFLTVYPCGSQRPDSSNVNFAAGEARSNLVVVGVGSGGRVCVYSRSNAHLVADVMGTFDTSSPWAATQPRRVLDTRSRSFGASKVAAGSVVRVPLPSDATFAALNVTAADAKSAGFLTVFPCGAAIPQTSTVTFEAARATPNLALVPVRSGTTCIYTSAETHIVVDMTGSTSSTSGFAAVGPQRLMDTRLGTGSTSVTAGSTIRVATGSPQPGAVALLNVAATGSLDSGFLTVYPCDEARPGTSNTNFAAAQTASALAVVRPSATGEVCVFSSADVDVIVDATGALTPPSGYHALRPIRIVDTRIGLFRRDRTMVITPTTTAAPAGPATTIPVTTLPAPTVPATTITAAPATSAVPTPQTTTSTTTLPPATTSPPTTAPSTTSSPAAGSLPNVSSGVNVGSYVVNDGQIPASSAYEPSGNFRTFCEPSHLSYNDPIVFPRQTGASHLHLFFGNTLADANSTYQSLRTTGSSTCQGGPLNRSAYWMPAMFNATNKVVMPEYLTVYYKGNGTQSMIGSIGSNPNGLRMIAGYNAANPGAIRAEWSCNGGGKSTTVPSCPSGGELKVELRFPMCWNGRDLDSADHRGHMAYGTGGAGWVTAQGGCPASHPVHLPEYTFIVYFTSDGNSQNWFAASDRMPGMAAQPNGSTLHADWFGAWENSIQDTWTQECIREMRNCVWGQIGDGRRLPDQAAYSGPSTVDPPARPSSTVTSPTATAPPTTTPTTTPTPAAPVTTVASQSPSVTNDNWLFKGDSITLMSVGNGDALEQLITQIEPGRQPQVTNAAVGGTETNAALTTINTDLAAFPGKYVVLAYGTNDYPPAFAMETLVQRVIAAGKVPVIPLVPWNRESAQSTANVQNVNAQITSLYGRYPQILRGPDLYSAFLNRTDLLRSATDVHPNEAGQALIRTLWAQAITTAT